MFAEFQENQMIIAWKINEKHAMQNWQIQFDFYYIRISQELLITSGTECIVTDAVTLPFWTRWIRNFVENSI